MIKNFSRRLCIAPMMDRTDRHFRYFMRLVAPWSWLYTEMVTSSAILRGDRHRYLQFDEAEHPVGLQLGGSDPEALAEAALIGAQYGYDEINLNVGCPSDRVQHANFGAALMLDAARVKNCVLAMREAVQVPVTVKTRLGVDEHDSFEFLCEFIGVLREAGCKIIILHARKAWLQGLSPKQNREIPPLDYERVYQIKRLYPDLEIIINGGIKDVESALNCLDYVDGVMLGRAAWQYPMLVAELDARLNDAVPVSVATALRSYLPYVEQQVRTGHKLRYVVRHLLGIFAGEPGGRHWRRALGALPEGEAGIAVLRRFIEHGDGAQALDPRVMPAA